MEARLAQQAKQARQVLKIHEWANESRFVCIGLASTAYSATCQNIMDLVPILGCCPLFFEISAIKCANWYLGTSTRNACQSTLCLYMGLNEHSNPKRIYPASYATSRNSLMIVYIHDSASLAFIKMF